MPAPGQTRPKPEKPFRIAGLPAVGALFATRPEQVERLFYTEAMTARVGPWCAKLAAARKPYRMVPAEELQKVAGSPLHGGIVAVAPPRPVPQFDPAAAAAWAAAGEPLLVLDGVSNPHNLGAIVRTAAFFGLKRILLSDHPAQALPSESAYRVAEGGLEHVALFRSELFLPHLKGIGRQFRTVGTALGGDRPPTAFAGTGPAGTGTGGVGKPVAAVLGNEEDGLPPATLAACSEVATIPGSGLVQSLNVAATAAILCFLLTGR